jgi:hypothetical protein
MVNKIFVLHADLGAAKNIIKNILLLSPEVYFPFTTHDRLEFLLTKIYNTRPLNSWFDAEYTLKNYPKFGIELLQGDANVDDVINLPDDMRRQLSKTNFALDLYNRDQVDRVVNLPWVRFMCVYPRTDLGVRWQVRAYVSKKSENAMHNFTYEDPKDIERHKEQWGHESWSKVNIYNFYQAVLAHRTKLQHSAWPSIELEQVIYPDRWEDLIDSLIRYFAISLNHVQCLRLLKAWSDLHWPLADTCLWHHNDIFDGSRSQRSDYMICNHSCQK